MKQGLLVVSFGSSVEKTRKNITWTEQVLCSHMPQAVFARAFTSPRIRAALKKRGEEIFSPEQALEDLHKQGVTHVIIQPTHLLPGIDYEALVQQLQTYRGRFEGFLIGKPLLSSTRQVQILAQILMHHYPKQENVSLVYMGHGTEHFANLVYPALEMMMHTEGRSDCFVTTVEGWPDFETAAERIETKEVCLIPLMLTAGEHVLEDMLGEDSDSLRGVMERRGKTVNAVREGLGSLEKVREMYGSLLDELLHEACADLS